MQLVANKGGFMSSKKCKIIVSPPAMCLCQMRRELQGSNSVPGYAMAFSGDVPYEMLGPARSYHHHVRTATPDIMYSRPTWQLTSAALWQARGQSMLGCPCPIRPDRLCALIFTPSLRHLPLLPNVWLSAGAGVRAFTFRAQ